MRLHVFGARINDLTGNKVLKIMNETKNNNNKSTASSIHSATIKKAMSLPALLTLTMVIYHWCFYSGSHARARVYHFSFGKSFANESIKTPMEKATIFKTNLIVRST